MRIFVKRVVLVFGLFACLLTATESFESPLPSAEATAPCITTITAPRCLSDRVTTRMDSPVPTVLTPLGSSQPFSPVTIIDATGTSSPQSSTAAKYMRAVNCETSSAELCVKKIVINGVEARLVPGYTGSCIGQMSQTGFLGGPAMGCTQSMDLNSVVQLPDYVVLFSDKSSKCVNSGQSFNCVNQQVEIIPNPTLSNVPRITTMTLELQTPSDNFATQMGIVGSNGTITKFIPSVLNHNVVHVEISDPTRKLAKSTSNSGELCPWWTPIIDKCTLESTTTEINYDPRFFFYPAPLKNVKMSDDGVVEVNPNGIGSFYSSNTQHLGLSSMDFTTGSYGIKVAGPHESHLGGLNTGDLTFFWPTEYLLDNFGLKPSEANATTLPFSATSTSGNTILNASYQPKSDGLLVTASGITFSAPLVAARRVLLTQPNKKIPRSILFSAAGLRSESNLSQATITFAKKFKSAIVTSKSGLVIKRRGSFEVSINYTDAQGKRTSRVLKLVVK